LEPCVSFAFALILLGGIARADPPRSDQLPVVDARPPAEVLPLRGDDGQLWPEPVAEHLAARIRERWDGHKTYGVLESRVGLSLDYPLVNARLDGSVVIPVVEVGVVPVRGRVVLPDGGAGRRLVILIDVSQSSNQRAEIRRPEGAIEQISVRDGGVRTAIELTRRLIEQRAQYGHLLDYRPTQLSVIAFAETSWSLLAPGTDLEDALAALEKFALNGAHPEGRSDAVCALELASDWLLAPDASGHTDVVLLTNGDLPFSNRFTNCSRLTDFREQVACLRSLNHSECSSSRSPDPEDGHSDIAQLFALARTTRPRLRIFPVLFQNTRPPRFILAIASHSGGQLIRVGLERGIESAVEQLLMDDAPRARVDGVAVHNLQASATVYADVQDDGSFSSGIGLIEGPNDLEVDVRSGSEILGRYRFRVQMSQDPLSDFLTELKEDNRRIAIRGEEGAEDLREVMREVRRQDRPRDLQIAIEPGDAAPSEPRPHEVQE
jgi:hypothetical protein